jgi:murein L,D-transpeptidase YafK
LAPALVSLAASPAAETGAQRRHAPRVEQAREHRASALQRRLRALELPYPPPRVFIRVLKRERSLEVWAAGRKGPYRKVRAYPVCAASGKLGPKRRQGDRQVPEGLYHVSVYNPWSRFHLSLGINYPNASDRRRGYRPNLGSAIMIHGGCASIGCVAITDHRIEEVYLLARGAARRGHRVPVHIFPTRLDDDGMRWLRRTHRGRTRLLRLWRELRPAYRHFQRHRTLPRVRIDRRGRYRVSTRTAGGAGSAPPRHVSLLTSACPLHPLQSPTQEPRHSSSSPSMSSATIHTASTGAGTDPTSRLAAWSRHRLADRHAIRVPATPNNTTFSCARLLFAVCSSHPLPPLPPPAPLSYFADPEFSA